MSELINRIPGVQSTLATLKGVVDTTAQLKAAQRFTGRSGQLGYLVVSDDEWDRIEAFPYQAPPAYAAAEYSVRYVGDGTQPFPIVIPSTDIRVNGTGDSNRLQLVPGGGFYQYSDGSGDVQIQVFELPDQDFFGSATEARWRISLIYRGTVTLYMKERALATSDGTISIVRTA